MKRSTMLIAALAAAFAAFAASDGAPVKTAVFAGNGPRGRGCVEWFRLVNASPDLDLMLVDAAMIRAGALEKADMIVVPGGVSVAEKRDLGPEGAAKLKDFIRAGGGYIGTCGGCCLLMDERDDPERGISVIPFHRIGSKDGYMMPIALNEKGAEAMGMKPGEYKVSYHAGPIMVPSTNYIEGASFDVWATYASDFDCPKSDLRMFGKVALVGGTYGRGKVFAITCHPEANVCTRDIVKGAFRYVLGREISFPERIRRPRSLVVGVFASVISGLGTAKTLVEIDSADGVDFFPMTSDEILTSQLDRVDYLILPNGSADFYRKKYVGQTRKLVEAFAAAGGKTLVWGTGAAFAPSGARIFASGDELAEFIRREAKAD